MLEVLIILSLAAMFVIVARRLPDVTFEEKSAVLTPPNKEEAKKEDSFSDFIAKDDGESEGEEDSDEEIISVDSPLVHSCSPIVQSELIDGDRLFEENKFVLAERRYLEVAAKDPTCVHALNRLGIIFLEQNNELQDAEDAFRTALKYAPNNGFLNHNLGLALYRQGKHSEAARYFELSVEGGSRLPNRYANLGMCYLALRQYGKGVSALRKALALDKGNQKIKEMLEEAKKKDDMHKKIARAGSPL